MLYQSGMSMEEVGDEFGCSAASVHRVLRSNEIAARPQHRRVIEADHGAFDDLTDPTAAYWMGFLFADGTVDSSNPKGSPLIGLNLNVKDLSHIESFREFIEPHNGQHRVITKNEKCKSVQYRVSSQRLTDAVLNAGRYEGVISDELATSSHFWRGVIDGDGWLLNRKNGRWVLGLCGHRRIIDLWVTYYRSLTCKDLTVRVDSSIFRTDTSARSDVLSVVTTLYGQGGVSLERKQATADLWMSVG